MTTAHENRQAVIENTPENRDRLAHAMVEQMDISDLRAYVFEDLGERAADDGNFVQWWATAFNLRDGLETV